MKALYLDCDGFFASCEESADRALHGRPVGVSTTDPDNPGGVLIAVNPAAKRLGVGKGENAREARRAVPELVVRAQRPVLVRPGRDEARIVRPGQPHPRSNRMVRFCLVAPDGFE